MEKDFYMIMLINIFLYFLDLLFFIFLLNSSYFYKISAVPRIYILIANNDYINRIRHHICTFIYYMSFIHESLFILLFKIYFNLFYLIFLFYFFYFFNNNLFYNIKHIIILFLFILLTILHFFIIYIVMISYFYAINHDIQIGEFKVTYFDDIINLESAYEYTKIFSFEDLDIGIKYEMTYLELKEKIVQNYIFTKKLINYFLILKKLSLIFSIILFMYLTFNLISLYYF
jgi:hypothetical protein